MFFTFIFLSVSLIISTTTTTNGAVTSTWTVPTFANLKTSDCKPANMMNQVQCTQLNAVCYKKFTIPLIWVGTGCNSKGDGGCKCGATSTGARLTNYCGWMCEDKCTKHSCTWIDDKRGWHNIRIPAHCVDGDGNRYQAPGPGACPALI
jgi:hypothetical protein